MCSSLNKLDQACDSKAYCLFIAVTCLTIFRGYRVISAHGILGAKKCLALPMFHAFTGCDTVSSFSGRGKKTAWETWNVFPEVTDAFIGKYGSTSYIGMDREKKMAANRKGIGPTTLKCACNSTTNTCTKYLLVVMHKTLCSVWLTFVRRENETVQNCPIVLKNSSSYYYYY